MSDLAAILHATYHDEMPDEPATLILGRIIAAKERVDAVLAALDGLPDTTVRPTDEAHVACFTENGLDCCMYPTDDERTTCSRCGTWWSATDVSACPECDPS
jgi:hypothetical protein